MKTTPTWLTVITKTTPTWLTVITHPDRPAYLQRTLDELDRAGGAQLGRAGRIERWIAVDGDPYAVPDRPGWGRFRAGNGTAGNKRVMLEILKKAHAAGAPEVLYFEDDVVACRDAVLALYLYPVPPTCGFVTAFVFRVDLQSGPVIRDARSLPLGFWGTQAIKVGAKALAHLSTVTIPAHSKPNSCDVWLGEQVASSGAPLERFKIIRPSLFQHVGKRSIAHPTKDGDLRRAVDFQETFDALSVLHNTELGRSDDTPAGIIPASLKGPAAS